MNSRPKNEEVAVDPFAADIFAAPREEGEKARLENKETLPEWSRILPRVSSPAVDWDKLWRGLTPDAFSEVPSRLAQRLARLLNSPSSAEVEFLPLTRREINAPEDFTRSRSWWLTVGVETSEAEIWFEIDNSLAAWMVDAALGEKTPGGQIRELTPSEASVLEFMALNLVHEANQVLQAPLFKFRALETHAPAPLRRNAESGAPSVLVANWQTVRGLLPSIVKLYLSPESMQSLRADENRLLGARRNSQAGWTHLQGCVSDLPLRMALGEAQLSFGDLAALEPGDILLLEKHSLKIRGASLSGQAEFFLGAGRGGRISGELTTESAAANEPIAEIAADTDNKLLVRKPDADGSWRIVVGILPAAENLWTSEERMTEAVDIPGELPIPDKSDEQIGLAVENLAVTLRVELEARRLSLAEVGGLRENQILELGVKPTDPVNLLIDNQKVGRGELVIIEERLGVRITKLLR